MRATTWIAGCLGLALASTLTAQQAPGGGGRGGRGGGGAMQGMMTAAWEEVDKEACLKALDTGLDGAVSKEEFDAADLNAIFGKALMEATQKVRQRGGGRGGMMRGGLGAMMALRQYDSNGDMTISEDELAEGLEALQRRLGKLRPFLLEEFDGNKDGQLDEDESRRVREFSASMAGVPRHDADHNWELSEEEVDAAWNVLSESCLQYNEMITNRFDTDGDGALSEAEAGNARKQMEERRAAFRGGGGFGGRGPGGGGGPGGFGGRPGGGPGQRR